MRLYKIELQHNRTTHYWYATSLAGILHRITYYYPNVPVCTVKISKA